MADKNTIKNWFKTNLKPTQAQFWAVFDSYFHKDEKIPITAIDDIENILAEKADAEILSHHLTNETAHATLFDAKEDKSKRGAALGYAPLNEFTKLAIDYLNVVNDLVTGGADSLLTAEQGKLLQVQITAINTLLTSDNLNLDNVQEIVDAIETVQTSLSTILVNDLTTGGTTKALTAEMGKTLKGLIDGLTNIVSGKEPAIMGGLPGQYYDYNKTWQNVPILDVSIKNAAGVEQFKVSDSLRFKGAEFDPITKQVNISALSAFTAYVDPSLGNNTTAEMENSKKPFQSIDGVFARYTSDQPTSSFVRIYLVNAGNYAWTQKIYSISFEIYSDKEVTVNLSTSTVVGSLFYNTSLAGYNTYFNFPLGTLYCSGSASVNFNHERRSLLLNVKAIYWNANPQYGVILAFQYGVTIQNLSELSINSILFSDISICKTPMNLSVLNTLGANARILCKNGITVGVINMSGLVNNLFVSGENWNIGDVNGVLLFSYTHTQTIKINFNNSTISGGMKFENENGNLTFSGYIKSMVIIGVTGTTSARRSVLNLVNLTIEDLKSDGFYFYDSFAQVNILNCYINQSVGTYLIKSLGRTSTATKFNLKVEKTVYRQTNAGTLIFLDNNENLENINLGGFESNCLSISNIANTPSTFDLLSFKDKKKEIVIRSKIDLIGRVLSSTTTYIIDGTLTLLSGEYIEVPPGGLTIAGYGFDVSIITKNVSGQSIFTSPVGGSGNFVTKDIQYNSGLGSVFNIIDSDGSHAIELNDVNFQSCASLGTLNHYRQFTGTTCGIYGCNDGFTLEGSWNGFKIVNTNAFGFASTGTLIKKGVTTLFANRLYLDLNLSLPAGAKICDFDATNFSSDKLLQVVNCLVKVNGLIDPTTTASTFPNITPFSTKAYFTNNIGLKNSFNEPYGLKTSNLSTYVDDAAAATGGIQLGEVYVETSTGYFKTRMS